MKHSKTLVFFFTLLLAGEAPAFELFERYSKLTGLTANFEQEKEIKNLGVKLHSSGNLRFRKPDFFEWMITSPKALGFRFEKDQLQLIQDGAPAKNADLSKLDPKMLNAIRHMKAWLTMDTAFIEANYAIRELGKNTYEFTPKGESKIFAKITVESAADVPVKTMELSELSGDLIRIRFSGTKLSYEK